MTAPVADSFPPGRPWPGPPGPGEPPSRPGRPGPPGWPGAPGWPAPHREPPAYPAVPPSRVWTDQGDWPGGLYQRLLERRIVMASGLLDGQAASVLSAQLLTLDADGDGPVRLELQGLDAELPAALTVMGVLDVLRVPVTGYVAGQIGGPALGVLAACGQRLGYPSAVLALTEPTLNAGGTATQVRSQEEQIETMVNTLYIRLAEVTGREVDEIRADARQGRFLTVPEAVGYGLLDAQAGPGGSRVSAADGVSRTETAVTAAGAGGVHPGPHLAGRAAAAAGDPAVPGPGRVRAVGADRAGHRPGPAAPAVLGVPVGGRPGARPVPARPAGLRPRPGRAGPGVRVGPGGHRGRGGRGGVGHPERDRRPRRRRDHAQRQGEPGPAGTHGRRPPVRPGRGPGLADVAQPDVVLAGDAFYDRDMAGLMLPFLERASQAGALVLVGDPGRAYLPRERLAEVATYDVPVERVIEDADVKPATVWRLR